jgi:hypothetical protein
MPLTPSVILVRDGDSWKVGNIKVDVLHTPGHTPEHISFMITDTAGADKPMGVFTGDFLFVGDVGRPDLLEEAAGYKGTKEIGARQQFQTVARFKALPDYLQIWPGHGAGSACGKALGAIPSTTLGYEKLFNPAFAFDREDEFVRWLLDGQPEAPKYFAQMKKVNKLGPPLTSSLPTPVNFNRATLDAVIEDGGQVFDLRNRGQFAFAHVPGRHQRADGQQHLHHLPGLAGRLHPPGLYPAAIDRCRARDAGRPACDWHRLRARLLQPGGAHTPHAGAARGDSARAGEAVAAEWHRPRRCARQERVCRAAHRRRTTYSAGLPDRPAGDAVQRKAPS